MIRLRPHIAGGFAALAVVALAVFVAIAPARAITAQDQADIDRIERYINDLSTVAARFMQVAPDGGIATGSFYLSRPGRMRVEYDPPVEILMVATGRAFFFWDGSVRQTTQLGLEDTPAFFMLKDELEFGEDVTVRRLTRTDELLQILLVESDDPSKGAVELTFTREPFELRRWSIFDPDGQETRVGLLDTVFGPELEERLFLYIAPEIEFEN